MQFQFCIFLLGANHLTFEGGGGWKIWKKNSLQPPKEGKKIMHGKLRGKKYHAWIVRQKKFLQIIDIFQWVGWLVQIPACSVANQSYVLLFKQPTLHQKQVYIVFS